jgi:hypothetical protein
LLAEACEFAISEWDLTHAESIIRRDGFDSENDPGLNERLMLVITNALALIWNIAKDAPAAIAQRVP